MKNIKKIITTIVIAITFVTAMSTLAASNQYIYLPSNQVWVTAGSATRNTNYSTVSARCHSVYPNSGTDNYESIQCRVLTSNGIPITSVYILNETAVGFTSMKIREGYISYTPVTFQFRGNKEYSANAVVSYLGY